MQKRARKRERRLIGFCWERGWEGDRERSFGFERSKSGYHLVGELVFQKHIGEWPKRTRKRKKKLIGFYQERSRERSEGFREKIGGLERNKLRGHLTIRLTEAFFEWLFF